MTKWAKVKRAKLKSLERLEKRLELELIIREKAFENGFYGIDKKGNIDHFFVEHYVPYLRQIHTRGVSIGLEKRFNLKDYGKTWALTIEELEGE